MHRLDLLGVVLGVCKTAVNCWQSKMSFLSHTLMSARSWGLRIAFRMVRHSVEVLLQNVGGMKRSEVFPHMQSSA